MNALNHKSQTEASVTSVRAFKTGERERRWR